MIIRRATAEDLPAILEIYNEAVLTTTASYDEEPRTLEHRRQWFAEHEADGYPVFVAAGGGADVIGWSALNQYHARAGYRFTAENSIYVHSRHRGRGVGKGLMQPLIDAAKARGLHAILAGIDSANEVSIRLHRSFGFEQVAHFREVGFKFNRWLDVVYLELLLPRPAAG